MPRVETERRRRRAASLMLIGRGSTAPVPAVEEVDELRWKRLLKTALPTDPLRGRAALSLFSLDMVAGDEKSRALKQLAVYIFPASWVSKGGSGETGNCVYFGTACVDVGSGGSIIY